MPRTKKDPSKPKGAKGAYIFFLEQERKKVDQVDFATFSADISSKWKQLSEDDKKPYMKLAEEDKKRFKREMENYSPSVSDDEGQSRKRKRKKDKDPNAPKRNMSAYFHYSNEQRPKIKEKNPDKSVGEISKLIAELWNKMSDDDKKPYNKLAEKDKDRYLKELAIYQKDGNNKRAKKEE